MELATLYCMISQQLWHVRRQRNVAFLQSVSPASQRMLGVHCHRTFVGIWLWDTVGAPLLTLPGKCETLFSPFNNLSPLSQPHSVLAVLWAHSAAPVFCIRVLTAFSEGSLSPLPVTSTWFSCVPQLCWSRSSSTNHMILDSFTAVLTTLQSSCETHCSCCFTPLCLQKATAGSYDAGAALQAPEITALLLYAFSNNTT